MRSKTAYLNWHELPDKNTGVTSNAVSGYTPGVKTNSKYHLRPHFPEGITEYIVNIPDTHKKIVYRITIDYST